MQKTVFIYALNCPTTGRTRYIGKAANPQERLKQHFKNGQRPCYRVHWIQSLLEKGLQPKLEILDEVPEEHWPQWEVAYIEFFREQGFDLVNANAGGIGGHKPSEETLAKKRSYRGEIHHSFGKSPTLETRAKYSIARRGEKNVMFGKTHTLAARAKISAAGLGRVAGAKERTSKSLGHLNKKTSQNTSGFVGVSWHKVAKKWCASLSLFGRKHVHLGLFSKIEDAVFVRNLAFNKNYGSN